MPLIQKTVEPMWRSTKRILALFAVVMMLVMMFGIIGMEVFDRTAYVQV